METESDLGLGDYLAALRRRRLLMAGVVLPIVLIGAALALALPDVYRSTARFRVVSGAVAEATASQDEFFDQYILGLTDKVLGSESLRNILRDTDPYPDLEPSDALGEMQSAVKVQMITQTILEPGSGRERNINTGFTVAFEHRSPDKAAQVAQQLAATFVELSREDNLAAAQNKVKFFSGEADRLSKQIADFERQLADFKSANFDRLPEAVQANMTLRGRAEQELDRVEREVRTLQQNRVFVVQQLRQAQAAPTANSLQQLEAEYARKSAVYADTHPDVIALRRQIELLRRGGGVVTENSLQAQLEAQRAALAEARQRYSESHPDVRRMMRDIEVLEARIAAGEPATSSTSPETLMSIQLQTQLNSIDTQIGGLQSQAAELRGRIVQQDAQLESTPEVERGYQSITRGLDSARDQYNQMINKRMDADVEVAAINSGSADRFALFAPPGTPREPAGPQRLGILFVAVLASVLLALAAVVVAEMFDPDVRGSRDVRSVLGIAPLAVVPQIHNSVYRRRHSRRVAALAGSVLLGAPVLYLLVRLMAA